MIDDVLTVLQKWLWIEDRAGLECILAVAVASQLPGDPLWAFVVDPPGALKTEICRSLKASWVYNLDTLTPESLVSGFRSKKGRTVDILADLNGKLLVIKDFTTILQKQAERRDELFGRLRAAYDGELVIAYGSGAGRVARQATFGIIAAVTPMIDEYMTIHALLGERFISIRTGYNRRAAIDAALAHQGREVYMRQEIAEVVGAALEYWGVKAKHVQQNPAALERIAVLADMTAILRTPVPRNYRNEVTHIPEAEVGTRLAKQFQKLAVALQILGCYTWRHIQRVSFNTIPLRRWRVVKALASGQRTTKDLMVALQYPRHTVLSTTEDLWLLGVVERTEGDGFLYQLTPDFGGVNELL